MYWEGKGVPPPLFTNAGAPGTAPLSVLGGEGGPTPTVHKCRCPRHCFIYHLPKMYSPLFTHISAPGTALFTTFPRCTGKTQTIGLLANISCVYRKPLLFPRRQTLPSLFGILTAVQTSSLESCSGGKPPYKGDSNLSSKKI